SYAVQHVSLNTVHCAECYGGSNLYILNHACNAHAGLAAIDRRDRRGPADPANSQGQSPQSKSIHMAR
ncbi:hypothetical protein, partial [Sphingopyxis sp.]|uniref:hypothetical protein n=1 Tax=Sphingopyxis sp. TaxID=1908224 RepID=UPI0040363909